jgi:hypothetical protein
LGNHAANTLINTIRHPLGDGYFFWAFPTASLIPLSVSRSTNPEKTCASCGRSITWRKKWESCWNEIRYCSDACRRRKTDSTAEAFESAILARLAEMPLTSSLCPSEIARTHSPNNWREHMEDIRRAARRLVAKDLLQITQNNQVVDPSTAKGPIRLRLPR